MTGTSGYKNNSLHVARKYAGIFAPGHYLFLEAHCELRGTDNIMSKDKYLSIFSRQLEAIAFIILQIFFQRAQFWKLWNSFSDISQFWLGIGNIRWNDVFRPIARKRNHFMDYNEKYV